MLSHPPGGLICMEIRVGEIYIRCVFLLERPLSRRSLPAIVLDSFLSECVSDKRKEHPDDSSTRAYSYSNAAGWGGADRKQTRV